nr:hypothetical protein [Mesorhizobium sp.]
MRAAAALFEDGVIGRTMPHGDILGYAPPLIINRKEIKHHRRCDSEISPYDLSRSEGRGRDMMIRTEPMDTERSTGIFRQ